MAALKGATVAIAGDSAAHELNVVGRYVLVTNRGAGSVYLGGSDVNATTHGYELKTGESIYVDCAIDELFAFATVAVTLGILAARRPQSA